jgi:voltage-dependent anion channel protein 2
MPCVLFKDIGKTAKDTLSDDYDFDRKLKIKTKTSNNVTFTTEGTMGQSKAILAKLSAGFSHSSGINVKKLQVTTHGRLIGEAAVKPIKGLNLTFKAEDGSIRNTAGVKYRPVGKVGAEYTINNMASTAEVDFANNAVNATACFGYENFTVGLQGALNIERSALSDRNVGISYAGKDFSASVVSKKSLSSVMASFDHKPSTGSFIYAAQLEHDIKSQSHALTVGGRYKPDSETTFCGKVNSDGLVSLAFIQKVRPFVSLTTSALIDVKNIEGDSHKFGLGLTLG